MPMYIIFRDEIGLKYVELDEYGVAFCDGFAYFSSADGEEYKIPVAALEEIRR